MKTLIITLALTNILQAADPVSLFNGKDLTLQLKELRPTTGNSGIQTRSPYAAHPKGKGMWMHGPQIDIHPPTPFRTGLIYDETFETRHWIHPVKPSSGISPADTSHKVTWSKTDWNTLTTISLFSSKTSWSHLFRRGAQSK